MAAPQGNDFGTKLKDEEVRQEAFRQYCEHLALGKSQKSFCFEHPKFTVTYKTLNKYIEDNPEEFPPIQRQLAEIRGYKRWEQITEDSAVGINKDANTASLQMVMRNKFSWDKEEKEGSGGCSADKILERMFQRKDT